MLNNDRWEWERSSGYAGWRCQVCGVWVYENKIQSCLCNLAEQTIKEKLATISNNKLKKLVKSILSISVPDSCFLIEEVREKVLGLPPTMAVAQMLTELCFKLPIEEASRRWAYGKKVYNTK